mgnify:CR=1 FL=1
MKVEVLSKPTRQEIRVQCPECQHVNYELIPIARKGGKLICHLCRAKLHWTEDGRTEVKTGERKEVK